MSLSGPQSTSVIEVQKKIVREEESYSKIDNASSNDQNELLSIPV